MIDNFTGVRPHGPENPSKRQEKRDVKDKKKKGGIKDIIKNFSVSVFFFLQTFADGSCQTPNAFVSKYNNSGSILSKVLLKI